MTIEIFLNNIIARAEAVLAESEKRILHAPTVEFFRGQKIVAEQVLQMLSGDETPEEILRGEIVKGRLMVYNKAGELTDIVFNDE